MPVRHSKSVSAAWRPPFDFQLRPGQAYSTSGLPMRAQAWTRAATGRPKRAARTAHAPGRPGGQVAGVVFYCVVEQRGADDVGVADVVMADDPQRNAQGVVDVRFALALAPVRDVQAPGELQGFADLLLAGRVANSGDLGGEPRPQPLLAVKSGDGVQRHQREDLLLGVRNAGHVQVQVSRMMVTTRLAGHFTE
jgi:hypothetical protein